MMQEFNNHKTSQINQTTDQSVIDASDVFAKEVNDSDLLFQERKKVVDEFPIDVLQMVKDAADFDLEAVNRASKSVKSGVYQTTDDGVAKVANQLSHSNELMADYQH